MKLEITNIKEPVNTVRMDLEYNPSELEVVDISTRGSFANIFIQKEIDNKGGYARIAGGLASPGFYGDHGVFAVVDFRALKPGITTVNFLPTSLVLANNGRGDNILSHTDPVSYLIVAKKPNINSKEPARVSKSDVLGASTDKTQMIFYDEKEVLGSTVKSHIDVSKGKNIHAVARFLGGVGEYDNFILSKWQKFFSR